MKYLRSAIAKARITFACWLLDFGQSMFDKAVATLMANSSSLETLGFLVSRMEARGVKLQSVLPVSVVPPPPLPTQNAPTEFN